MSFDQALRRALARKDPPPGFADRVLDGLSEAPLSAPGAPPTSFRPEWFRIRWVAALAASVLIAVASGRYYVHRQALADAERVKREVRVALQIASEKLNDVQQRLQKSSQREF